MLEGIIQIGNSMLSSGGDMISNLVKDVPSQNRKGKQMHVLKFCFNTQKDEFKLDAREEIDSGTALKYAFIGSADGPASPQWFATSSSYLYHITETLSNLTKVDLGDELNKKLKAIFENYYVDLGDGFKPKNRYILNYKKYGVGEEDVLETLDKVEEEETEKDEKQRYKNITSSLKKAYSREFENYVKTEFDIKKDEIGLYTILVDGTPLSDFKEYRQAILKSKQGNKSSKKIKGFCSMCGSSENLTSDLSRMKIKYYTTNQIIFASELKSYDKNMLLCSNCLNKLTSGENYIKNKLNTRLVGFTVYLIPHFIVGSPMNKKDLDKVSDNIQYSFNTVKNLTGVDDLKTEIQNIVDMRNGDTYFLINIMFYKKSNQATKIQKLIKDVNPSVFQKIMDNYYTVAKLGRKIMGINYKLNIDLQTFYFMTPVRLKNSEPMNYRKLLQMYDAILTQRSLKLDEFIRGVISCAKIEFFDEEGYNVNGKSGIYNTILKANFCIKFLEYMGCIEEGEKMDISNLKVKDDLKVYILNMGYDEQQSAMFLLGCLIGEIGNAQYKRMGEDRKPILNKLNFGGVDKNKVIRLTNEVFNKLIQEKIRKYNEVTFSECKRLMDANKNLWKLNKHENLFYILSGYSYDTTKAMLNKGGKENEQ
ncbi:CRISPR-associated protein (cas_TM1802) [Clostridium ragsdalei P11]|uniref:CRISPR-associated protein (Cas_TM1802) n=1 Tax=Clostridium ragsdalei P11 TaxID=1353534 RepID=A0A1A6B3T5_9CLOT|nr:TIGR02556 family CRISPR-associated protein [Clostridium ragsdalei]OBR96933.1 CRISPR-associated protein (cas_TM1802) [Clostridium ragsdalei P11]